MPEIDPKISTWLNFIMTLLMGAGQFSDLFPQKYLGYAAFVGFALNTLLHGASAPAKGPLTK